MPDCAAAVKSPRNIRVKITILVIAVIPAALWLTKPARMPETAAAQSQAAPISLAAAALVRDIENNLIAPCCWTQPVSEHPSEVSDLIRAEVRRMAAEGKSRDEILDYYVAKYGERILAAPRARGINVLAYAAPFAALILGGWTLFLFGGKRRRRAAPAAADLSPLLRNNSRYNDIIEKELRELDD
jgi:cytochrome c-type biogenesis protein CcmH